MCGSQIEPSQRSPAEAAADVEDDLAVQIEIAHVRVIALIGIAVLMLEIGRLIALRGVRVGAEAASEARRRRTC